MRKTADARSALAVAKEVGTAQKWIAAKDSAEALQKHLDELLGLGKFYSEVARTELRKLKDEAARAIAECNAQLGEAEAE